MREYVCGFFRKLACCSFFNRKRATLNAFFAHTETYEALLVHVRRVGLSRSRDFLERSIQHRRTR